MTGKQRLFALVTASMLLAYSAVAQRVATVWVDNITTQNRSAMVTCHVPFADDDEYRGAPLATADGAACESVQVGARWPDGSWRQARVSFPAGLGPSRSTPVSLVRGAAEVAPGFTYTPAVREGLGGLTIGLLVGARPLVFTDWEQLENGRHFKAAIATQRLEGTPVWAECIVEFASGMDYANLWVHYGASDLWDPAFTWNLPEIKLVVIGPRSRIRHDKGKVLARAGDHNSTTYTLVRASKWGEGESQAIKGVMLFAGATDVDTLVAEMTAPVFAAADWRDTGAFGPFGDAIPPLSASWNREKAHKAAVQSYNAFSRMNPWEPALFGCNPVPADTGSQRDFSTWVMSREAQGHPVGLHPVERGVYQEACRAGWYRDRDGGPMALSKLRDVHMWDGMLFWTSPNKFAKPITRNAGMVWPHGHKPHDRQHTSLNYAVAYALLTGDRLVMRWAQHWTEQWILCNPSWKTGNSTIDGRGAERAVGRTLQAAAGLYLLTGRLDLAKAADYRIGIVDRTWPGKNAFPDRPGSVYKDAKNFHDRWEYTMKWQQAIGARGLKSWDNVWGNETANELSSIWAKNCFEFGIFEHSGQLTTTQAVEFKPGIENQRRAGQFDNWWKWERENSTTANPLVPVPNSNAVDLWNGYTTWYAPAVVLGIQEGVIDANQGERFLRGIDVEGDAPVELRAREWVWYTER